MKYLALLLVFFIHSNADAIDNESTVRGRLFDSYRTPLEGATIKILNANSEFFTTTDAEGNFLFEKVAPGRYILSATFTGFQLYENEILVISGKPLVILIELRESTLVLNEVVVSSDSILFSDLGVRTISIEKTMRVPANFFDPVRMVTSYPGVVATNDQSNSVMVKGYSPNALSWRLQGLDIVNPNHLANAGTFSDKPSANGGGVSILSAQVLDKTDFYSGSFPVQYGNVLSGALNMILRPGDKQATRYTAQASLIGIDLAAETPIVKGKSSLLANYRYSTVGLLSDMGVDFGDERISFQDFSFHYDHDQSQRSHLSIFGFGGLSSNQFDRKDQSEWKEEKDRYDIDFDAKSFGIGFTEDIRASNNTLIKLGSAFSGQFQGRESSGQFVLVPHLIRSYDENNKTLYSGFFKLIHQFSKSLKTETGMYTTYLDQQIVSNVQSFSSFLTDETYFVGLKKWIWQPFTNLEWKFGSRFDINLGLRGFAVGSMVSAEPRVSIGQRTRVGMFRANYGVTHLLQPLPSGHAVIKSLQSTIDHLLIWKNSLSLTTSLYYHRQQDVPVNSISNYSLLNNSEEMFVGPITNQGEGRNYGVEITAEKKFNNQLYFMAGGSVYKSEYSVDNDFKPSRFDGGYTMNALAGKEWNRKKNNLGVHIRVLYLGGLREREIDATQSQIVGRTWYVTNNGYSNKLPDYFRVDCRIAWRKDKQKSTRTISLDIQNLSSQQNIANHYYDTFTQSIRTRYQLGIIPVLVYRVDF